MVDNYHKMLEKYFAPSPVKLKWEDREVMVGQRISNEFRRIIGNLMVCGRQVLDFGGNLTIEYQTNKDGDKNKYPYIVKAICVADHRTRPNPNIYKIIKGEYVEDSPYDMPMKFMKRLLDAEDAEVLFVENGEKNAEFIVKHHLNSDFFFKYEFDDD